MIKSNISISSNIYIRSDPDIRRDRKYTEKITGTKLLNDIRRRYVVFESIPFTMVQQEFFQEIRFVHMPKMVRCHLVQ